MESKIIKKNIKRLVKSLQGQLEKDNERFLKVAVFEGALLAQKNFPGISDATIDPFITRIRGHYKTSLKKISLKLKGSLQKMFGGAYLQMLDNNINELKQTIKNELDKQQHWNLDIMRLQMFGHKTAYKTQRVILFLLGLTDSLLLCSGFLRLGDIIIISAITGILLGAAQVAAVRYTTLVVREIKEPQKQKRYIILVSAFFVGLSLLFGCLRYYFAIQATGPISILFFNPLYFTGLNLIILIASCLITVFYHPSKKEIEELEEITSLEKKIQNSKKIEVELTKQKDDLRIERQAIAQYHTEFLHDQDELFAQVEADFDAAVGAFKDENIAKRSDNIYPPCFKRKHLPLSNDDSSFEQIN